MALSDRDREIYVKYIEKYGKPTKYATSLIAFAETDEINKPISYEKARKIIKYYSTHPYIKPTKSVKTEKLSKISSTSAGSSAPPRRSLLSNTNPSNSSTQSAGI